MNNIRYNKKIENKDFHLIGLLSTLGGYFLFPSFLYITLLFAVKYITPVTDELSTTVQIFAQVIAEIPIAILLIYFCRNIFKIDFAKFKKQKLNTVLLVIGGFVAIFFANILVNLIYEKLGIDTTSANEQAISQMLANKYYPVILVGIVLFAPLLEEFIFRKFLFGVIEEKLNWKPILAILISSSLFSLVHLLSDGGIEWQFFFMYFPMALILSLSYHYSNNNILVPITIHFINNLMASVFSLIPVGAIWLSMIN
ncbi:MAG TPA: CPBP family intramembrane metalloprotease [Acholeplasmataceae bacterium]|nr:CPBP family intramembrane metalloprotease [Acholeplasmataceae bacterium]